MVHVRTMESRQTGTHAREDEPVISGEAEATGRVTCARESQDAGETRVIWRRQDNLNPRLGDSVAFLILDDDFSFAPEAYDRQQPGD
jgi:hypothetical protein